MTGAGFPHSDIHGSTLGRQLPVASRSHPRPSSASGAKASTVGSSSLELLLDARARYGILKGSHRQERSPKERRRLMATGSDTLPDNGTEVGPTSSSHRREAEACHRWWSEGSQASDRLGVGPTRHPERASSGTALLRKEVIQPHLPVRLPCYDFTPIAGPTFDGSLLAVGPPASGVTNFRGVTGGVYKARERIHPGVADPGLLATPASWSRVADSNPN
jgi:hypothetical protein